MTTTTKTETQCLSKNRLGELENPLPLEKRRIDIVARETIRAKNRVFQRDMPVKTIVTERTRSIEEMTTEERSRKYHLETQARMKEQVVTISRAGSGGNKETPAQFSKRMGIKRSRGVDVYHRRHDRQDLECGECFELPELESMLIDRNAHRQTPYPVDILEDSQQWLKEYRWTNPDGYAQYVEDLEDEMGAHFEKYADEYLPRDVRTPLIPEVVIDEPTDPLMEDALELQLAA